MKSQPLDHRLFQEDKVTMSTGSRLNKFIRKQFGNDFFYGLVVHFDTPYYTVKFCYFQQQPDQPTARLSLCVL